MVKLRRSLDDPKGCPYGPLSIVLVRLWIAKIDENAVTYKSAKITTEAVNHRCTRLLIRANDFAEIFRIELRRKGRRPDEVTEHNRKLATLCLEWGIARSPSYCSSAPTLWYAERHSNAVLNKQNFTAGTCLLSMTLIANDCKGCALLFEGSSSLSLMRIAEALLLSPSFRLLLP